LTGDTKLLGAAEDILSSFGMKVQIVPEPEQEIASLGQLTVVIGRE